LSRRKAAETGQTLGDVISEALVQALTPPPISRKRMRYDLPVSGTGGLQPGVDLDDSAGLEDLMMDEGA
jgi:hypothetical protein